MSTIKLYRNNITLRLPILKFITSNKRFENDFPYKKENSSNMKESKKNNNEELINKNFKKRILSSSKLQNLSMNPKTHRLENKYEKAVQTIHISNTDRFKIDKKKKYINILKDPKIIINKEQNKVNDENILKEKIYKINKKKRKKGLNNYSQIIHYYNNIHNQKIKDKNRMSNNSNRIYLPKFGQRVEKNPFCNNNKINLNKTQENIEIKSIKKYISLSHLFERKTELNKENNKNDFNLNRSLVCRNNSLPNFDFMLSQNNNVINEDNYKIIKSNGKFLPKNILCKDKKIK